MLSSSRNGCARLLHDASQAEPDFAADDDRVRPAVYVPAAKRRVAALGMELVGVDRPRQIRVDDRHVGIGTRPERSLVDTEKLRRVICQLADDVRPAQIARFDQTLDRDRHQGLETHDPEGRRSISRIFFSLACGAWSVAMISIVLSLSPSITASTSLQGRSGGFILKFESNAFELFIGQSEMVRASLRRDSHAPARPSRTSSTERAVEMC